MLIDVSKYFYHPRKLDPVEMPIYSVSINTPDHGVTSAMWSFCVCMTNVMVVEKINSKSYVAERDCEYALEEFCKKIQE